MQVDSVTPVPSPAPVQTDPAVEDDTLKVASSGAAES